MSTKGVVLILGAGPRIGASVAESFANDGYKVALVSRNGSNSKNEKGYLSLKADLFNPDSIPGIFSTVLAELHTPPTVVIYNAGSFTAPPDADSVLSITAASVVRDLNINTISPYVAAQQAVAGWAATLDSDSDAQKTFIYTGNKTNEQIVPMPMFQNIGMGKSASAFWIGMADATYEAKKYRFFYADERTEDGQLKGMAVDGPAHGEFYLQLAKRSDENVPWQATFVKGKGYVSFK